MGPDCLSRGSIDLRPLANRAASSGLVSNTNKLLYSSSQKCSYNKCASFYSTKFLDDFYLATHKFQKPSTRTYFKMVLESCYLIERIILCKRN